MTGPPQVGSYHAVTPGTRGPDPQWFDAGYEGLMAALTAAAKAPQDGVARVVTSVSGRVVTTVCTVTNGKAIWPEDRDVVPARSKQRKGKRS